jgi:hypothetical protein
MMVKNGRMRVLVRKRQTEIVLNKNLSHGGHQPRDHRHLLPLSCLSDGFDVSEMDHHDVENGAHQY